MVLSTTPMDCVSCSRKEVDIGEPMQRCQLDDRLGFALEQHWQHHDVSGPRLAQARLDARVFWRYVTQQDLLLFYRTLAHQADTEWDAIDLVGTLRIAGEQAQLGLHLGRAFHLVNGALVGVHQRDEVGEQRLADYEQVALAL
jgi:hypothetical protein